MKKLKTYAALLLVLCLTAVRATGIVKEHYSVQEKTIEQAHYEVFYEGRSNA